MRHLIKTTVILSLIHLVCNTYCIAASDTGKNSATVFTHGNYAATVAADVFHNEPGNQGRP
jgi:hypothetical protein